MFRKGNLEEIDLDNSVSSVREFHYNWPNIGGSFLFQIMRPGSVNKISQKNEEMKRDSKVEFSDVKNVMRNGSVDRVEVSEGIGENSKLNLFRRSSSKDSTAEQSEKSQLTEQVTAVFLRV